MKTYEIVGKKFKDLSSEQQHELISSLDETLKKFWNLGMNEFDIYTLYGRTIWECKIDTEQEYFRTYQIKRPGLVEPK